VERAAESSGAAARLATRIGTPAAAIRRDTQSANPAAIGRNLGAVLERRTTTDSTAGEACALAGTVTPVEREVMAAVIRPATSTRIRTRRSCESSFTIIPQLNRNWGAGD
jgi:hypothetical protein